MEPGSLERVERRYPCLAVLESAAETATAQGKLSCPAAPTMIFIRLNTGPSSPRPAAGDPPRPQPSLTILGDVACVALALGIWGRRVDRYGAAGRAWGHVVACSMSSDVTS